MSPAGFPAATVHAFEPVPGIFRNLEKNLSVNVLPKVTLHNLGFMDKAGRLEFYYDPAISGRTSARNLADDPLAGAVSCEVKRLDDFVAEAGVFPDLLKVDVEGAELFVFQGGQATLAKHHPVVFTEMLRKWAAKFEYHPDAILDLFSGQGYGCYFAEGGGLVELHRMTDDVAATNFFFLHREVHGRALAGSLRS